MQTNETMNIAVSSNLKFYNYLYVMLTSLFENHPKQSIHIYLMSMDISYDSMNLLEDLTAKYDNTISLIPITNHFPDGLPYSETITIETYFRLLLPELLPTDITRILYLDVDLVVLKPLQTFYQQDFEGHSLIACADITAAAAQNVATSPLFDELRKNEHFTYFNAGILLMNLEKLRKITSFAELMEWAIAHKDLLTYHDQDLLNALFSDDVIYSDPIKYNLPARTAHNQGVTNDEVTTHTAILHYAGPKPWNHKEVRYILEHYWWDYAKKTPMYTELLEAMLFPEIQTGYMDQLFRNLKKENDELHQIVDKCMQLLKMK